MNAPNPANPAAAPVATPAVQPMATVAANPAAAPVAPPKEAAQLKKAYTPRKWLHHREDANGNPIPPGPTMVYFEAGNSNSGVLCNTEEEYIDALNRGARDSFAPEAWE